MVRFDLHRHLECANVYEALVYLQHDMIVLMMYQYELRVTGDLDENQQYEVELKERKNMTVTYCEESQHCP
jgi:hypothetical protein